MKQWIVVYTQPLKEKQAQQHLLDQDYEVYMPCFKKTRRHARKIQETLAPLFPRYIFVSIDSATTKWRSINGTRGVVQVLMNQQQPSIIADQIINDLKAREDADGLVSANSLELFSIGEKVRVLDGAFKDYTATFSAMNDKDRVELLLSFLGRETKVCLPAYAIEAA